MVHAGAYSIATEGRTWLVDATTALLLSPQQEYTAGPVETPSTRGSFVALHPAVLGVVFGRPELRGRFPRLVATVTPMAALIERCLVRTVAKGSGSPIPLEEMALHFIRELVGPLLEELSGLEARGGVEPIARRPRHGLANAIRARLTGNLTSPVRLSEIADWVGCSTYHAARVFRAETGQSIHRYITRLRLLAALERLPECSDLSVLAVSLGFSSHSHFTASFRAEFGMTPSAFRRAASASASELERSLRARLAERAQPGVRET